MKAFLALLATTLALSGCLTIPHLDQRSPEVRGRVVDAATWRAIPDAKVEFVENSALAVLTDENGEFVIRATLKPELFVPLDPAFGEMNIGMRIEPLLRVTCDGYRPFDVNASHFENLDLARYQPDAHRPVSAQGPLFLKPIKLERLASL